MNVDNFFLGIAFYFYLMPYPVLASQQKHPALWHSGFLTENIKLALSLNHGSH